MVIAGLEAVGTADLGLHGEDAGTDELDHPAATPADQMVVPLAGVDVLVEVAVAAQAIAPHQAAGDEQIEIAVDGGARDLHSPFLQCHEELLGVQVAVAAEHLFQQRPPLGGHPQALLAEKIEKAATLLIEGHGALGYRSETASHQIPID